MKKQFSILIISLLFIFSVSAQTKDTQIIDVLVSVSCDDYLARMDGVFNALKSSQNSKTYVFIYEGKLEQTIYNKKYNVVGSRKVLPAYGEANARISTMKKRISLYNSLENFVFIKAGFREMYSTEFWLVPNGAIPPKPTPTLQKLKYRKGKATGFCWTM